MPEAISHCADLCNAIAPVVAGQGDKGLRGISDAQLAADGNNFTGARLILASGVIWTHCYWLATGVSAADELSGVIGLPISHLAVNGFFFVSGFLICQSLFRQAGVFPFLAMRVARIWPALIVCTMLTLAVFAMLSDRAAAYLIDPQSLRFVAMNLVMLKAEYEVPALVAGGKAIVVNGSLWTIPWELRCYLVMALGFAVVGHRRAAVVRPVLLLSVAAAIGWAAAQQWWAGFPATDKGLLYNLDIWLRLWGCFAAGALVWLERGRAMPPWWLGPGLAVMAIVEHQLMGSALLATPAVFALVLTAVFGGGPARAVTAHWPDFSYGIYIFAFPVMVLLQQLVPDLVADHRWMATANLVAVLPLAALSWFWVEKPALSGARSWLKTRRAAKVKALDVSAGDAKSV
ncbi:MAG: acyltransferase [Sphingopyxis sp.]|nr:acyltransferase [Sphingopyxis sp.]